MDFIVPRSAKRLVQGWAKEWSLGCVYSPPAAKGSQEAGFTQPRDHCFAQFFILRTVPFISSFLCLPLSQSIFLPHSLWSLMGRQKSMVLTSASSWLDIESVIIKRKGSARLAIFYTL